MGAAKQAIPADIGGEADVAMAEHGSAKQCRLAGRKILPIVEGVVLVAALVAPLLLQDYLTVFATRVIILALFALSFDLVWGYAGIMSFGQALFFGSAGYGVALLARDLDITNRSSGAARGHHDRAHLRAAARRLPAAGPASLQRDLRLAGHADRLLRGRPARARLVLSRWPERHPLDPADDARQLRVLGGPPFYYSSCLAF